MRIKVLQTEIKKNGYNYKLIKRDENRAIYAQYSENKIIAYEVFKNKLYKPHPKALEDCENFDFVERFPSDEEFGKRAWTYKNLADAEKTFDRLIA